MHAADTLFGLLEKQGLKPVCLPKVMLLLLFSFHLVHACLNKATLWKFCVSSLIYRFSNISLHGAKEEKKILWVYMQLSSDFPFFLFFVHLDIASVHTGHGKILIKLHPIVVKFSEKKPLQEIGGRKRLQEVWQQLWCESFSCNSLVGETIRIWQHWIAIQLFPKIFIYFLLLFTYTAHFNKCSPSLVTFSNVYYNVWWAHT